MSNNKLAVNEMGLKLSAFLAMILIVSVSVKVQAQATLVDIAVSAGIPDCNIFNCNILEDDEPSIAVNPANPQQIAVVTFSGNWGANTSAPIWWSNDSGLNWTQIPQIPQPPLPAGSPPTAVQVWGPGDQKIAFDVSGNLFIAELGVAIDAASRFVGPPLNFVFRQTGPFGANLTPGVPYGDDQPQLDVDARAASPCAGQLYSPWLNFVPANERSMVSNSITGGGAMANVAAGNNINFPNRTTRSAIGPDGKVYIIYKIRQGTDPDQRFENVQFTVNRSDDCGTTWTGIGANGVRVHQATTVKTWFTQVNLVPFDGNSCDTPANGFGNSAGGNVARARSSDAWIAVDQSDGDVYAAYVSKDASGFAQIYVARSTDQGVTWTSTRVTDGARHSGYPEVAVAANGTVGVLYVDYDDSGQHTIFRHRFARSFGDGAGWVNETLQSMDPNVLVNGTNCFLWGDYEGLTAAGNTFYGVFTGESIGRATPELDPIFFKVDAITPKFEYAAKVVCGEQKSSNNLRLARGLYATTINIHNPNDSTAIFYKKLALTYPPEVQRPGEIIPLGVDTLLHDQALKVDCIEIKNHLNFSSYIEGFVIIQSMMSLDVSAVYTTARPNNFLFWSSYEVVSIDVEQIREREITRTPPPPPPPEPEELDHFKIYEVDTIGIKIDYRISLTGQFDSQPKDVRLFALSYFANPTSKVHPGIHIEIKNSNRHFNLYAIKQDQQEPHRTIRFRNQFGQHSVITGDPRFLMVPAQKTSDVGSMFPDSLDHFKCYEVIEIEMMPNFPGVVLEDQFGPGEYIQVVKPHLFCVPVKKTIPGSLPNEIMNPNDILVIYNVTPEPNEHEIKVKDQFEELSLRVIRSVMLAIPSEMQTVVTHND